MVEASNPATKVTYMGLANKEGVYDPNSSNNAVLISGPDSKVPPGIVARFNVVGNDPQAPNMVNNVYENNEPKNQNYSPIVNPNTSNSSVPDVVITNVSTLVTKIATLNIES
jgi:hypothetical protein